MSVANGSEKDQKSLSNNDNDSNEVKFFELFPPLPFNQDDFDTSLNISDCGSNGTTTNTKYNESDSSNEIKIDEDINRKTKNRRRKSRFFRKAASERHLTMSTIDENKESAISTKRRPVRTKSERTLLKSNLESGRSLSKSYHGLERPLSKSSHGSGRSLSKSYRGGNKNRNNYKRGNKNKFHQIDDNYDDERNNIDRSNTESVSSSSHDPYPISADYQRKRSTLLINSRKSQSERSLSNSISSLQSSTSSRIGERSRPSKNKQIHHGLSSTTIKDTKTAECERSKKALPSNSISRKELLNTNTGRNKSSSITMKKMRNGGIVKSRSLRNFKNNDHNTNTNIQPSITQTLQKRTSLMMASARKSKSLRNVMTTPSQMGTSLRRIREGNSYFPGLSSTPNLMSVKRSRSARNLIAAQKQKECFSSTSSRKTLSNKEDNLTDFMSTFDLLTLMSKAEKVY